MAHDEKNEAHRGDQVVIESKPISARKRFALVEIVEKEEHTLKVTVELPEKKSRQLG